MLCLEIRESHSRSSAISNDALASLEAEGFTREEASSELGHRGRYGALASLVAQGIAGEGEALSEQGCQKRDGRIKKLINEGVKPEKHHRK